MGVGADLPDVRMIEIGITVLVLLVGSIIMVVFAGLLGQLAEMLFGEEW
jgi:hypothetical protein